MAQTYQWHEIFSNQEKLKSQRSFNEIQFNAEGESFVCGVYGNIDNSNAATWMGDEFVSQANYTGNSYNKNYLLSKFDANDNLLWTVYSIKGCYENSNTDAELAPTADGGVVALLKMRFSQGDKELAAASDGTTAYPLAWIVDADGDTTKIDIASKKWPYQGIIAKFSSNGTLAQVDIDRYDPQSMQISIIGDLFHWTVTLYTATESRYYAVDADSFSRVADAVVPDPELPLSRRIERWLLPVRLRFTSWQTQLVYPSVNND